MALVAACASCGRVGPRGAIDRTLAECIPADTLALAGVNLAELRASAMYGRLPAGAGAFLKPMQEASYLLVAYNGKDVLAVARGAFSQAPPGATLLAKDLAIAGPDEAVRAAVAQRKTGRTGASWLLDRAAEVAAGNQIWLAAQGGVSFLLTGDAANLNRLLSFAEYAGVGAHFDGSVRLEALAAGRTPEAAARMEESLRALLTLAATGMGHDRPLAELLRSVPVKRDGVMVRAEATASAEQAAKFLGAVAP